MLDELRVSNSGLLSSAAIEPGPGLVVVTGETGAGKTLLLGALGLLAGEPARRSQIGPAGDELEVQGRLLIDDGELVARRRVSRQGRSRAYLDGVMVPAKTLAERVGPLIELVAQSDALRLAAPDGIRAVVDGALDEIGTGALADYRSAHEELARLSEQRRILGGDLRALQRELDVVRFQADEIAAAGFSAGDDLDLTERAHRLRNATTIAEALTIAIRAVDGERGALEAFDAARTEVGRIVSIDPSLRSLDAQLGETASLLDDALRALHTAAEDSEGDPVELEAVERRIATLAALQRKYGDTLEEVLAFGSAAVQRAGELTAMLAAAESIGDEHEKATVRLTEAGARLRAARAEAGGRLATAATAELRDLGFTEPVVRIVVEEAPPTAGGADRLGVLFASDAAVEPAPVSAVASGGELSRLVLALRLASGVAEAPIVAFDEVDAGIGGATALAMGHKLHTLAAGRQVLCVTHLPQVAAFADTHLAVRRTDTVASVERVEGAARIEELTRMLSGLPDSEKGRHHAAELLALATSAPDLEKPGRAGVGEAGGTIPTS